jgi:hypothetical protein
MNLIKSLDKRLQFIKILSTKLSSLVDEMGLAVIIPQIERFTLHKGSRDASNLLECDTLKDRAIDLKGSPNR